MNTKLLISGLGAALVLPAAALLHPASSMLKEDLTPSLRSHDEIVAKNFATTTDARLTETSARPAKVVGAAGDDIKEIEKYGTLDVLLSEDFSKLPMGSIEEPDFDIELAHEVGWNDDDTPKYPEYPYPWWNFKHEYIHTPHFGVGNAYPAGECIMFNCEEKMGMMGMPYVEQAHISTANVDLTKHGGLGVIEFKARSKDKDNLYSGLLIEAADTRNMGPIWDIMEYSVALENIPSEWTTYRFLYQGGGSSTIFNIVGVGAGLVYLDDIKVYGLNAYVGTPTMLPHSDYKGTSFVANWTAVKDAEYYLLTCYSQDLETGAVNYLLQDVACEENKRLIDNAVNGETYYLYVKAVKGEHESISSLQNYVFDLVAPTMNKVEKESEWVYKASWSEVPSAEVYNYWAYDERVAEADGIFNVTDEDFNGVTNAEGQLTGWNMFDGSRDVYYSRHYPKSLKQQGWLGTNYAPLTDCIALDIYPWYYGNSELQSSFQSPEMDMSKDGGKFEVTVKLAGDEASGYNADGEFITLPVKAAVALFTYNEETGEMEQKDRQDVEDLTRNFKEYKFKFEGGTERSIIGIFGYNAPGELCIDDLKITQKYKKGEKLFEAFLFDEYHGAFNDADPNEITVEIPLHATGYDIYHKVSAVKTMSDGRGNVLDRVESPFSELEYACKSISEVKHVQLNLGRAFIANDRIVVENPEGAAVAVYELNGTTLYNGTEKNVVLTPAVNGVYLVKIGNQTIKLRY